MGRRWDLVRYHLKPDSNPPPNVRKFDHLFPVLMPREVVVVAALMAPPICVWAGRDDCESLFLLLWPLALGVAYFRGVWPFKVRRH